MREFANSSEREFWMCIYANCVRAGNSKTAAAIADKAVEEKSSREGESFWAAKEHGA